MCIKEHENWFQCKECFREGIVERYLFERVYKGQQLCVKCRVKKGERNLTQLESAALVGEESIDKATNHIDH